MRNKWIGALSLLWCSQLLASELVIESWRADDKTLWEQKIIPAFEAKHPGITVKFHPVPNVNYSPMLWENLKGGTAGDLITCRPFDDSFALFKAGYLTELTEMAGMENFPALHKRLGKLIQERRPSAYLWPRSYMVSSTTRKFSMS